MTFDEAFERLIGHEGGYSNNPADPGGETMFGITKRVAEAFGYTGPMKDLPLEEAKRIAKAAYWNPCKADDLPEAVRFDVFDGAYNSGVGQSVKWLQRACGVLEDGKMGQVTIAACSTIDGGKLASRYNGHRLGFMADLKKWPDFGRGWARRIAENLKAA